MDEVRGGATKVTFEPDSGSSDQDVQDGTIKRSRSAEGSNQAIKANFCRSKFLIPVANASVGDIQVTTPCQVQVAGSSWPLLWF